MLTDTKIYGGQSNEHVKKSGVELNAHNRRYKAAEPTI
jgi:hypothetical protein